MQYPGLSKHQIINFAEQEKDGKYKVRFVERNALKKTVLILIFFFVSEFKFKR